MNQHKKFILTPVSDILQEAISAMKHIGSGIETYPLSDYLMQSIFIKMTGAQEQKMKCIAWELATNDFDFRRDFMKEFNIEFSAYKDKGKLYSKLIEQIKHVQKDFKVNKLDKTNIRNNSLVESFLDGTNLLIWSQKSYVTFKDIWKNIANTDFALDPTKSSPNLLKKQDDRNKFCLFTVYEEHLYRNRNRIAHNTKSFQQNLPALELLKSDGYQYENYFLWFSILILIDEIFMELYKVYLETLEQKKFI